MSTRKEEERNEKIIRGLMKLPPNRRCINCNSLGPQYVCTNFWTFICITCSGIHREFTHRVKSVSMAKFTSQEVEALQRGGNQRARETHLKEWDPRQKLPDSSNVDRVREFIKNAYVDRRYAGGMTSDKPPRDMQNLRNREEDTRRASSYHSYSQSPPYEYQYEDRRYGKQASVLTRRPGSDRSLYEGKVSSFIYSPGRLGEQMYEDRFANEGSGSRVSDYSVSSASDPSRSYTQSPTFHQDSGFSSPPIHPVRDVFIGDVQRQKLSTYPEANARRDADGIPRPQRTSSSGSFGSFDSNSMSLKSVNSGSLIDIISEPGQSAGPQQDVISSFSALPRSSVSADTVSLDLFNTPPLQQSGTSSTPSTNLFQSPVSLSAPSTDLFQPARTSSASPIDLFAEITYQHSSTTSVEQRSAKVSFPENEGWATFDLPRRVTHFSETKNVPFANMPSGDGPFVGNADNISSTNSIMQWPPVQDFTANGPSSSISSNWHGNVLEVQASAGPTNMQPWNTFENSVGTFFQTSSENLPQKIEPQVPTPELPSTSDQYMSSKVSEDSSKDRSQRASLEVKSSPSSIPFNDDIRGSSFTSPVPPSMSGLPSIASDRKSTNPFDLPYDSDLEPDNMFLEDMHSLQAALPNPQLPPAFLGGWYAHNSPQGGLPYIAGQASNAQLPNNISSQSTVASLGGNPFA